MLISRKRWEALVLEVERARAMAADATALGHAALARGAVAITNAANANDAAAMAHSVANTGVALANQASRAASTAFEEGKKRGIRIEPGAVVVNPMVDPDEVAARAAKTIEAIERRNYPAAVAEVSDRVGRYDDDAH